MRANPVPLRDMKFQFETDRLGSPARFVALHRKKVAALPCGAERCTADTPQSKPPPSDRPFATLPGLDAACCADENRALVLCGDAKGTLPGIYAAQLVESKGVNSTRRYVGPHNWRKPPQGV
jgi:hypothetical protein